MAKSRNLQKLPQTLKATIATIATRQCEESPKRGVLPMMAILFVNKIVSRIDIKSHCLLKDKGKGCLELNKGDIKSGWRRGE